MKPRKGSCCTLWLLAGLAITLTVFGMVNVMMNTATHVAPTHNDVYYYIPTFRDLYKLTMQVNVQSENTTSVAEVTTLPVTLEQNQLSVPDHIYLGCYQLSARQTFNFDLLKTSGIRSFNKKPSPYIFTDNETACLHYCNHKHKMYSYLLRHSGRCYCDNFFQTQGLDTLPCGESEDSADVYTRSDVTSLKYRIFSEERMGGNSSCHCSDQTCRKLQCHTDSAMTKESLCFVGPSKTVLSKWNSKDNCRFIVQPHPQFEKTNTNPDDNEVFCSQTLHGFYPAKCSSWNLHSSQNKVYPSQYRFYRIVPQDQLKQNEISIPMYRHKKSGRHKVLLLTFMRSGSTFLSEFFKGHPDSYYIFEPLEGLVSVKPEDYLQHLRSLSKQNLELDKFEPLHGLTSKRVYSAHEGNSHHMMSNRSIELLDRLFSCQFDLMPSSSIYYPTRKMGPFFKACIPHFDDLRFSCTQAHFSSCHTSQILSVKTIRAKLSWAKELLQSSHPDLKVVLEFRDPRGLMASRMKMSNVSTTQLFIEKTKNYCNSVMEDITVARELLKSKFKDQLLVIRYEDIVQDNIAAAKYIYSSLNMGEVPDVLRDHINNLSDSAAVNMTTNFKRGYYAFSTKREDSLKTAYKWKTTMRWRLVQAVDQLCRDAYKVMGYLPIKSEEDLRDDRNFHTVEDFSIT